MTTQVELDAALLERLRQSGRHRTNAAAVDAAMREYIKLRTPKGPYADLVDPFGKVDFHPDWDPRKMRGKQP